VTIHWWWKRIRQIRRAEEKAHQELAVSEKLYAETRETAETVTELAQRNMFAEIIRKALVEGYGDSVRRPAGKAGNQ